jgi:hypothetical protein
MVRTTPSVYQLGAPSSRAGSVYCRCGTMDFQKDELPFTRPYLMDMTHRQC